MENCKLEIEEELVFNILIPYDYKIFFENNVPLLNNVMFLNNSIIYTFSKIFPSSLPKSSDCKIIYY